VHYRDLSPAPRAFRRPAANAVSVRRARHVNAAHGTQWRPEREAARIPCAPSQAERNCVERICGDRSHADRSYSERIPSDHSYVDPVPIDRGHSDHGQIELGSIGRIAGDRSYADRVPIDRSHVDRNIDRSHIRVEPEWRPAPRQTGLERGVLLVSAGLVVGAASCFWLLHNVGVPLSVAPPQAVLQAPSTESYVAAVVVRSGKSDSLARSTHPMIERVVEADAFGATDRAARAPASDSPAKPAHNTGRPTRVAQTVSYFAPQPDRARSMDLVNEANSKSHMRLAALESPAPGSRTTFDPIVPRIPPDGDPKTALIDFQTAPFPYDGRMPGSNRPFLDTGEAEHRGTFGDPRVLLHIPPGFDANKPSVMIVFFHGHGAILARDVRDRQQVPAQISASGANAVLVAPQFAVDAADSSPGKFGEPGGFKRFLDEAAGQLARLHGTRGQSRPSRTCRS